MVRRFTPLALLVSMACTPQSAEITDLGIIAMLADSNSLSLQKNAVDLDGFDRTWNVDCRDLDDEAFRLPGALDICGGVNVGVNEERIVEWPLEQEASMNFSAYRMAELNDAETWRAEGVMTSEDDFQITFHVRLPGGSDMRLAVAIDPTFQPRECVEDADGNVVAEPLDGNWVENWSTDMQRIVDEVDASGGADVLYPDWLVADATDFVDGRLFYLNARSYQWDPKNQNPDECPRWTLPNRWRAGWAQGKFAEERFGVRTTRYGSPRAYATTDADDFECIDPAALYFVDVPVSEDGVDVTEVNGWRQMANRAQREAGVVRDELAFLHPDATAWFHPLTHDNAWRPADGFAAGLDAWVEMHNGWVMLDASSDVTVGGSASGAFGMLLSSLDSQSVFVVHGRFNVERIRKDRWVTKNIPEIKLEEYGTELCY